VLLTLEKNEKDNEAMNEVISVLPKNSVEEVRISLTKYHGHDLIDLRVYFSPEGGAEPVPTRKGICLNVAYIPDLIKALKEIEKKLSAEEVDEKNK
jgi:hypothetical protein